MKKKNPILIGCGALIGIPLILMVVGIIWLSFSPEGGVRLANEMEPYAQEYLEEHKILDASEELIAYYDVTISLDASEAAILTTRRVIYHANGLNTSIYLSDIEDIKHRKESLIGDIIEIYSKSGTSMKSKLPFSMQAKLLKMF